MRCEHPAGSCQDEPGCDTLGQCCVVRVPPIDWMLEHAPLDGDTWGRIRTQMSLGFDEGGLYHLEALVAIRVLRSRLHHLHFTQTRPSGVEGHSLLEPYERMLDTLEAQIRQHGQNARRSVETELTRVEVPQPCSPENPCAEANPLHQALFGSCFVRQPVNEPVLSEDILEAKPVDRLSRFEPIGWAGGGTHGRHLDADDDDGTSSWHRDLPSS